MLSLLLITIIGRIGKIRLQRPGSASNVWIFFFFTFLLHLGAKAITTTRSVIEQMNVRVVWLSVSSSAPICLSGCIVCSWLWPNQHDLPLLIVSGTPCLFHSTRTIVSAHDMPDWSEINYSEICILGGPFSFIVLLAFSAYRCIQ